jgi:hypothetical protein
MSWNMSFIFNSYIKLFCLLGSLLLISKSVVCTDSSSLESTDIASNLKYEKLAQLINDYKSSLPSFEEYLELRNEKLKQFDNLLFNKNDKEDQIILKRNSQKMSKK